MTEALEFLEQYVRQNGGDCERDGRRLAVLAPGELELREFWVSDQDTENSELEHLHVGHPFLEQLLQSARGQGALACRHSPPPLQPKTGLPERLQRSFQVRNASLTVGSPAPKVTSWFFLTFGVTYVSDEKRHEIRRLGIDGHHLCRLSSEALQGAWLEKGALSGAEGDLEKVYARAQDLLDRDIQSRRLTLERDSQRYLEVESSRLERYYEQLLRDLSRRENVGDKLARTEAEREARRRDLEQRFRLRIQANLVLLERIDVRREHLPVTLSQRKVRRQIDLTYNYLRKDFDPWACEGCQSFTTTLSLCERGHVLCPSCCRECRECRAQQCSACMRGAIADRCPGCREKYLTESAERESVAAQPKPKVKPKVKPPQSSAVGALQELCAGYSCKNLHARLKLVDQALAVGNRTRALGLLEETCSGIRPGFDGLLSLLERACECFQAGRSDKVSASIRALGSSRAGSKQAQSSRPPQDSLERSLEQAFTKVKLPESIVLALLSLAKQLWPYFRLNSHTSDTNVLAACMLYSRLRITQAQAAWACGVSAGKVSQHWRSVADAIEAVT